MFRRPSLGSCVLLCIALGACNGESSSSGATAGTAADAGPGAAGTAGSGAGAGGGTGSGGAAGTQSLSDAGVADAAVDQGTPTPSGGTLLNGRCRPGPALTFEELGDEAKVLVMKSNIFDGLTAHETGVYYGLGGDGVYRIPPGSDTPELLLATPDKRYSPLIIGSYLYFDISDGTNPPKDQIVRVPIDDPKATPTMLFDDAPRNWTADDTYQYVHDPDTQELYREPIGGGTKETLLSMVSLEQLELRDGYVYGILFTGGDDRIIRVAVTGGSMEPVVTASNFDMGSYHLADDGVYWNDYYGGYFTPYTSPKDKQPFLGKNDYVLKVDAERVYWWHDSFPSATIGWHRRDNTDCKQLITAENEYQAGAIGDGVAYITTFDVDNELFRIPLD